MLLSVSRNDKNLCHFLSDISYFKQKKILVLKSAIQTKYYLLNT